MITLEDIVFMCIFSGTVGAIRRRKLLFRWYEKAGGEVLFFRNSGEMVYVSQAVTGVASTGAVLDKNAAFFQGLDIS